MEKAEKVELHRPYYPLSEAAEIAGLKVDDLIHMAANGELPTCIIANGWTAAEVYSVDHSFDFDRVAFSISEVGPDAPAFPDLEADDFLEKLEDWQYGQEQKDVRIDNIVTYGRHGPNSRLYRLNPSGPVAVASESFDDFLINPDTAHIEIDVTAWKHLRTKTHKLFFAPDPEVLVKDVLQADKLVVMQKDLTVLIAKTSLLMTDDEQTLTIPVPENVDSLIAEEVRKARSEQAKKAGAERHKDTNAVRKIVWDLYASGKWNRLKVVAAAEEIYDQLPEHHHLFADGNGVRTFRDWIYDYKKAQKTKA